MVQTRSHAKTPGTSSAGSEEERRVRFARLASERLFLEFKEPITQSECQEVPTKTTDRHVTLQGRINSSHRSRAIRLGRIQQCVWDYLKSCDEAKRRAPLSREPLDLSIGHEALKQRHQSTLKLLGQSLRSLQDAGVSQSVQRLARLKARHTREDLRAHFAMKGKQRECSHHLELGSCGLVQDVHQLDDSLNEFCSWLDRATKIEASTGKLIPMDEVVDQEIESTMQTLFQGKTGLTPTNFSCQGEAKANTTRNSTRAICHYEECLHSELCGLVHSICFDCGWASANRYCPECRGDYTSQVHCQYCDWAAKKYEKINNCPECDETIVTAVGCASCNYLSFEGTDTDGHGQGCAGSCRRFKVREHVLCKTCPDTSCDDLESYNSDSDPDSAENENLLDDSVSDDSVSENSHPPSHGRPPHSISLNSESTHGKQLKKLESEDVIDAGVTEEESPVDSHQQNNSYNDLVEVTPCQLVPDVPVPNVHIDARAERTCSRCSWKLPSGQKPCIKFHFGTHTTQSTVSSGRPGKDDQRVNDEVCAECKESEGAINIEYSVAVVGHLGIDILEFSAEEEMVMSSEALPSYPAGLLHDLPRASGELSPTAEPPVSPDFQRWASSPPHTYTPEEVTGVIARWKARNKRRHFASIDAAHRKTSHEREQQPVGPLKRSSAASFLERDQSSKRIRRCSSQSQPHPINSSPKLSTDFSYPYADRSRAPSNDPFVDFPATPDPARPSFPSDAADTLSILSEYRRQLRNLEQHAASPISQEPRHVTVLKERLTTQFSSLERQLNGRLGQYESRPPFEPFPFMPHHPRYAASEQADMARWRAKLAATRFDTLATDQYPYFAPVVQKAMKGKRLSDEPMSGLRGELECDEVEEGEGGYVLGTDIYVPPSSKSSSASSGWQDDLRATDEELSANHERSSQDFSSWASDESPRTWLIRSIVDAKASVAAEARVSLKRKRSSDLSQFSSRMSDDWAIITKRRKFSNTPPWHRTVSQGGLKRRSASEHYDPAASVDTPPTKRLRTSVDEEAQIKTDYDFTAEEARLNLANDSAWADAAAGLSSVLASARDDYVAAWAYPNPSPSHTHHDQAHQLSSSTSSSGYRYSASHHSPYAYTWQPTAPAWQAVNQHDCTLLEHDDMQRSIIEQYRDAMYLLVEQMNQLNAFRRSRSDYSFSAYHFCLAANDLLVQARDVYLYYCRQWEVISDRLEK